MYSLEVVVTRNAEAAGREAGHSEDVDEFVRLVGVHDVEDTTLEARRAFIRGLYRGVHER